MSNHDLTKTVGTHTNQLASVRGYVLTCVSGVDKGKTWEIHEGRCSIGTHQCNTCLLTDPTVSRFHCELSVDGEKIRVVDLESKNGTLLDGVQIVEARAKNSSLIQVGETTVRLELLNATHAIRLAERVEFGSLVGQSVIMRSLYQQLERAAQSDATILLEGETGTGKGLIAESIHKESSRRDRPFSVVDCGAVAANLLESELFGHERGAFTGAVSRRVGAFEAADGGTIFLDEIGELPRELQPKLLRALEERQIRAVGSNNVREVNVRVIAATNRDLRKEVNAGNFRSDLFYRLAVIPLRVPALREHPEDIPLLVQHILRKLGDTSSKMAVTLLSKESLAHLQRSSWPGNVRELRNEIERSIVLQQPVAFDLSDSTPSSHPDAVRAPSDAHKLYHVGRLEALDQWEGRYLRDLLALHNDNVVRAAEAAGISRAYLYRLMVRRRIRRGE